MQKDFILFSSAKYCESCFLFQKLYFGLGSTKTERLNFETIILSTIANQDRYNSKESTTNPFYGKTHSLEARKAQSLSKVGLIPPFTGHTHTDKVKQLISQTNSGKTNRRKPLFINSVYY